jgi:hypothetical protein
LPTNVKEVIQIVENLKNTYFVGSDGLKITCLKKSIDFVAPCNVRIVNQSLRQYRVPVYMKIARIVPLSKSGTPTDESNYRPIATLPLLSKILESIMLV